MKPRDVKRTVWINHNQVEGYKVWLINRFGTCLCPNEKYTTKEIAVAKKDKLVMAGFDFLGIQREGDLQ